MYMYVCCTDCPLHLSIHKQKSVVSQHVIHVIEVLFVDTLHPTKIGNPNIDSFLPFFFVHKQPIHTLHALDPRQHTGSGFGVR